MLFLHRSGAWSGPPWSSLWPYFPQNPQPRLPPRYSYLEKHHRGSISQFRKHLPHGGTGTHGWQQSFPPSPSLSLLQVASHWPQLELAGPPSSVTSREPISLKRSFYLVKGVMVGPPPQEPRYSECIWPMAHTLCADFYEVTPARAQSHPTQLPEARLGKYQILKTPEPNHCSNLNSHSPLQASQHLLLPPAAPSPFQPQVCPKTNTVHRPLPWVAWQL